MHKIDDHVVGQRLGRSRLVIILAASLLVLMLALLAGQRARAVAPSNDHFEERWSRTDLPVRDGEVLRTWMWGPEAFTEGIEEEYAQAPDGQREVQYFDKARMEINAQEEPGSLWYVTNGLLVVELITGEMQVGDDTFVERAPASVPVAGDPDDEQGVTYATFGPLLDAPPVPDGEIYQTRLSRDGSLTAVADLADYGVAAAYLDDVTGHRIATPFWDFMRSSGIIYEDGAFVEGPLFQNPFYATGRPITEAYWVRAKVDGVLQDVLVQCFERRCLTYTPGNEPNWQVEAGNVGRHYYHWRYETEEPTPEEPTATPSPTTEPAGNVSIQVEVDCDADGDADGPASNVGSAGPCGPFTGGEVETVTEGVPASTTDVQLITPNNAISGTFDLLFNHPDAGWIVVSNIPFDVNAGLLYGKIANVFSEQDVGFDAPTITGGPLDENSIEMTFETGAYVNQDAPETLIQVNFSYADTTEPQPSEIVVEGGAGVDETQRLTPNGATGGSFTLTIDHPTEGLLTVTLPFDATATDARTAIVSTFNARGVGADAPLVSGGPANHQPLTFTFSQGDLAATDLEPMKVSNDDLTTTVTEARVEVFENSDELVDTWSVSDSGEATGDLPLGGVYTFQLTYAEDTGQADVVTGGPIQVLGDQTELTIVAELDYESQPAN